jgi:hypothetical protein
VQGAGLEQEIAVQKPKIIINKLNLLLRMRQKLSHFLSALPSRQKQALGQTDHQAYEPELPGVAKGR